MGSSTVSLDQMMPDHDVFARPAETGALEVLLTRPGRQG